MCNQDNRPRAGLDSIMRQKEGKSQSQPFLSEFINILPIFKWGVSFCSRRVIYVEKHVENNLLTDKERGKTYRWISGTVVIPVLSPKLVFVD